MCEACAASSALSAGKAKRKRLWELNTGWHCAIIGTCLTLADLRGIARKLGYRPADENRLDLQLHSAFVQEVGSPTHPTKLIQKLLDRKHAGAIRRFKDIHCPNALVKAWDAAYKAGDIPGPFWAAMTHPVLTQETGIQIYGDVHMLSHLVGASNRADIASLNRLEEDLASSRERETKAVHRHREKMAAKDREVASLHEEIGRLKATLANLRERAPGTALACPASVALQEDFAREFERMRDEAGAVKRERDELVAERIRLATTIEGLNAEVASLETSLQEKHGLGAWDGCPLDLDGQCILYVGGRPQNVCRLRALVTEWNGELIHHDGGMERSLEELTRHISRADAVVFPTDCVSHNAVSRVKNICRSSMKPFVPLRSSGVGSFVVGLRSGIASPPAPDQAN